jgi:hypothetical protein
MMRCDVTPRFYEVHEVAWLMAVTFKAGLLNPLVVWSQPRWLYKGLTQFSSDSFSFSARPRLAFLFAVNCKGKKKVFSPGSLFSDPLSRFASLSA